MKKTINTIFAAVAILGAFVAVCTADGSAHEMTLRLAGVAAFAVGMVGNSLTSKEAEQ